MHSHPKCLRLLFVVRSARHCLVWSSFLSVPFPVTGPFTWVLVYSSLSLSHLGLSVTGAQFGGRVWGARGWVAVFWRLGV